MYQVAAWSFRRWERIDDARGQRRFYQVEARQDIFGTWIVVKAWGKIGQRASRTVTVEASSREDALAIIGEVSERRKKHGYLAR